MFPKVFCFFLLFFVFIAFVYVKINKLIYRNFNHITTSWRMFHFKMNVECGLSIECTNRCKSAYWFESSLFGPSVMNRAAYCLVTIASVAGEREKGLGYKHTGKTRGRSESERR